MVKPPVSCFLDVSPSQLQRKWPEIQRFIGFQGTPLAPAAFVNLDMEPEAREELCHPFELVRPSSFQTIVRSNPVYLFPRAEKRRTCEGLGIRNKVW